MQGVRAPSQKRAQESWEHLLTVAEELIEEVGFSGVTAAELSRRSGISNGAIFWRVGNMDALFVAVHERFLERTADEQAVYRDPERWAGLELEPFIAASVRVMADIFERHGRMFVALMARLPADQGTEARALESVRGAGAEFIRHVGSRLARAGCAEPDVVAGSMFQVVFGALLTRATWPAEQTPVDIPWDRFVEDLCDMATAYAIRHTEAARV